MAIGDRVRVRVRARIGLLPNHNPNPNLGDLHALLQRDEPLRGRWSGLGTAAAGGLSLGGLRRGGYGGRQYHAGGGITGRRRAGDGRLRGRQGLWGGGVDGPLEAQLVQAPHACLQRLDQLRHLGKVRAGVRGRVRVRARDRDRDRVRARVRVWDRVRARVRVRPTQAPLRA